jgi:hypothetical protein
MPAKTAANARRFLRDLHRACPIRIARILTERAIDGAIGSSPMASGKEFTDRLFASRARAPSGEHEFDQLCAEHSPLSLGPCMDGSCVARGLFSFDIWSAAAMYTASKMRRDSRAP